MKTTLPEDYPKTFNEWVDKVLVEDRDKPKEPPIQVEDSEGKKRRMVDAALELA